MNIPALSLWEVEKAEKIFDELNREKANTVKELRPQLDSNNKQRNARSEKIGEYQRKQKEINLELAKLKILLVRPWSVTQIINNSVIAVVPGAIAFDRAKFTKKQAVDFLRATEDKILELRGESLALSAQIEPLQEELNELNIEWQSLSAQIESNRPLDWLGFQLDYCRNSMLAAGQ